MSRVHDLKILKEYFDAKLEAVKPFEIPFIHEYTWRVLITEVVYILRGVGLQDGYVALGERPEDYLENDFPEGWGNG